MMNTKLNKRVREAAVNINRDLEYLITKFKQQFKFRNTKSEDHTAGIRIHEAGQLYPLLKEAIHHVERNSFELRMGLLESGERKSNVVKVDKTMTKVLDELHTLKDYFEYVIKHRGELPRFAPAVTVGRMLSAGIYRGTNRLVKYNKIPMLRWMEELRNGMLRDWRKFVSLEI